MFDKSGYDPINAPRATLSEIINKSESGTGYNSPTINTGGNKKSADTSGNAFFKPVLPTATLSDSTSKEYQAGNFGNDAYGYDPEFINTLLDDTTDKYIGSVPKIGGASKVGEINATITADGKTSPISVKEVAGTAAKQAGAAVAETSQAMANLSRNEYESDIRSWLEKGKYWFDPNRDLKPDIDEFMAQMPSSTESLSQGTMTGGNLDNTKGGRAAHSVVEPTGFLLEKIVTAGGRNSEWKGAGEYIGNKAGQGAAAGAGSGWQGAVIGAVIGMVEGIFTWGSAVAEDKKRKAEALAEYRRQLKEWTINRNKRLSQQANIEYQNRMALTDKRKAAEKSGKAEKANNAISRRNQIASLLMNSNNVSTQNRAQRLARWGK